MKKSYNFLDDLTSDVMFEAYGQTLTEVFELSAEAMFSVICDLSKIEKIKSFSIKVSANEDQQLLYEFLSTLLTESEIRGLFLKEFHVKYKRKKNKSILITKVFGEKISPEKGGTVVKGITYYGLKLEKNENGYRVQVAMDI